MIYLDESGDNFNDTLSFMASELQTLDVCVCAHVDGCITDIASDPRLIVSPGCVEHKQTVIPHTH